MTWATKMLRGRSRWQSKCCDDTDSALVSTFLSSGLDSAKEELRSSWWTRARWYRNSSGRLGMGPPRETVCCGALGGHEQGGTGTAAVDWAWDLQEKNSSSSAKPGPGQQVVVK